MVYFRRGDFVEIEGLFVALSKVANYILPVLGVILLVYLIYFVRTLIDTLKDLSITLLTTEKEISKLDGPLNTVNELCKTVDDVHASTKKMANKVSQVIVENFETVKSWFTDINKKEESNKETHNIVEAEVGEKEKVTESNVEETSPTSGSETDEVEKNQIELEDMNHE